MLSTRAFECSVVKVCCEGHRRSRPAVFSETLPMPFAVDARRSQARRLGPCAADGGAPRLHHQWQPDEVVVEPGFAPETLQALEARGHKIVQGRPASSANTIAVKDGDLIGAADRRTRGGLAAGY
jgi:hypothetical protein